MKIYKRKIVHILVILTVILNSVQTVYGSGVIGDIKKAANKINELEDKKEQAESQVDNLTGQKDSLQGNLQDLNQKLSNAIAELNALEVKIQEKEAEIVVTGQQLEESIQIKEKQYQDMKLRISFMYKNGDSDMLSLLLTSESIADLLNKAEYIEAITKYDRDMLDRYENTCQEVAAEETRLKHEKEELLVMSEEMQVKKQEVDVLIADTQADIESKKNQIAKAEDEVDAYESQIAEMKAYEEKLEAQKAEEDRKRMEQIKKQQKENSNSSGNKDPIQTGGSDAAMLAALIECEAGGESYEGQLAVGSVVVNRVRSASFPNTVSGVIYQGGQFSPVASGRFALVLSRGASASCVQAAQAALAGNTNVSSLYFRRASSGIEGTVIGNHVFF